MSEAKRMLRKLGFWMVMTHSHKSKNTTHQCGTLVFGTDPRESVLDTYCRTHDVENLFVVDASFFPSSAAVNPGLTIVAQALRAADHIRSTLVDHRGGSLAVTEPVSRSSWPRCLADRDCDGGASVASARQKSRCCPLATRRSDHHLRSRIRRRGPRGRSSPSP